MDCVCSVNNATSEPLALTLRACAALPFAICVCLLLLLACCCTALLLHARPPVALLPCPATHAPPLPTPSTSLRAT